MSNAATNEELFLAWNRFIASGKLDYNGLNYAVFQSWNRSRNLGVNPYKKDIFATSKQIKPNHQTSDELVQAALPVMEEIDNTIKGNGFLVILTDSRGHTIKCLPQKHLYVNWAENAVGTNAIAILAATKELRQVVGVEHYCQALHKYTSSAVPIFDSDQDLPYLLALIGPVGEDHSHVISMLTKAAEKIQDRYNILVKSKELEINNQRFANVINCMSDGVLFISANHTVEIANPAFEKFLGIPSEQILGSTPQNLFKSDPHFVSLLNKTVSFHDEGVFIETPQGCTQCIASGYANLNTDGKFDGGIIIMQNMGRVQSLVNRFSGSTLDYTFNDIIGKSKLLKDTIDIAQMAARTDSNIVLQGESGSGKDIFAQSIHNSSNRRMGPFVVINCGAIPGELIASELFGYVEGAFTGARRGGKLGKFEMSQGGTIFLDEIGDMPFSLQVALLRVLQNKRIMRIGDSKEIAVDVRIICATNKNLRTLIEQGAFREDLYYRLNVISLQIPPLRERKEDIPLLIDHLLTSLGNKENVSSFMDREALDTLIKYNWPGNVRELQNIIERLVCIKNHNPVTIKDLPVEIISPSLKNANVTGTKPAKDNEISHKSTRKDVLAEEEALEIKNLLTKFNGNVTQVALEMGISRMTLYRKIKVFDIER